VVIIVGVPFAAVTFVWLMVRRPSDRSVAAFADTYAVPLTPDNVGQLRRYIGWSRRWRAGGVAIALIVVIAITAVWESSIELSYLPFIAGYSAGSLLGELFRPAERRLSHVAASLDQRRLRDFVVTPFIVAVVVMLVSSLIPAVYLLATSPLRPWIEPPPVADVARPQDWFVLLLASAALGIATLCWFACRSLIRAPIPADTRDRMAVRHAIRTAAILSVIGGSTMAISVAGSRLAGLANALSRSDSTVVDWVLGLAILPLLLGFWWGALLTLTAIPRFAPFAGPLPLLPPTERNIQPRSPGH
jgi:hypothetical protein